MQITPVENPGFEPTLLVRSLPVPIVSGFQIDSLFVRFQFPDAAQGFPVLVSRELACNMLILPHYSCQ